MGGFKEQKAILGVDSIFYKEYNLAMNTLSLKKEHYRLITSLVKHGLLSHDNVQALVDHVLEQKIPLIRYVVQQGLIDSVTLAQTFSQLFNLSLIDLDSINWQNAPLSLVNDTLIKTYNALPLFTKNNRLYLGVSDPSNIALNEAFKFYSNLNVQMVLVEEHKLAYYLAQLFSKAPTKTIIRNSLVLDDFTLEKADENEALPDNPDDDAPIVRYVQQMLVDAIHHNASDIHFEPYEQVYRIRWRQDGILQEIATPPVHLGARLAARLKIMSRLDISERRLPQDGRFKLNILKDQAMDFRVSTCPTLFGEKVVLRILNSTPALLNVDDLGMDALQQKKFITAIYQPQGMILVTGPTGSGKTRTLYTALNSLNSAMRNISTVEDPVEINLPGINQVNINPKAGLHFSTALRAFLRQDPDVIMVGEIRDKETADIAIQAAHTGHLVLSTLHTNSAVETLVRLINMGVAVFNIATSISLIIAQRLARKLCNSCKTREKLPDAVLLEVGFTPEQVKQDFMVCKAIGCDACEKGYKGRIGLYELLPITSKISPLIMAQQHSNEIIKIARQEGMMSLRESGLLRVMEGVISLEELNRVVNE